MTAMCRVHLDYLGRDARLVSWHVSTTCVVSLYHSGDSSFTILGEARRMEMPLAASRERVEHLRVDE